MSAAAPKLAFFKTAAALRAWLERYHAHRTELWVGLRKKSSGLPSVTYKEMVDEALCFGWIDGLVRGVDEASYMQRITPRKPRSIWSHVNTKRYGELEREGRVHAAGREAFARRDEKRAGLYSFEQPAIAFTPAQARALGANRAAAAWFAAQPPGYRRTATWWVVSAKQESTRERRLATLIADSAAGIKIKPLRELVRKDVEAKARAKAPAKPRANAARSARKAPRA